MTAYNEWVRRPYWSLYYVRGRRPWWWFRGRLLYIGETRRWPIARWAEHLARQPWAGQIGSLKVAWWRYRTESGVLSAERRAIHSKRPPYNVAHNGTRPARAATRRWRIP